MEDLDQLIQEAQAALLAGEGADALGALGDRLAAEQAEIREQLSDILEYAARLQAVETGEIVPTSTLLTERSRLRPDEAAPGLGTTATLRNAPNVTNNQFKVPPVME